MLSLLTYHIYNKTLSLLLLLGLFISKSLISADQVVKLAHQLLLLIIAFFNPVVKGKEKTHACHTIKKAASEVIKK